MRELSEEEVVNLIIAVKQMGEKERRQFLYRKSQELGRGGLKFIRETFHISCKSLYHAKQEIEDGDIWLRGTRERVAGGGRKSIETKYPYLSEMISVIVDPATYGTPTKVIKWTTLSLRKIVNILANHQVIVSHSTVQSVLKELGYSRQKNKKAEQVGEPDPDRNEQFMFIDRTADEFLQSGDPVISVDTKKKENLGNFTNNGTEYRKKHDPRRTLDHDFPIAELGKVAPYGIYCLNNNTGFVNLGTDHDTSEFAMMSILHWWLHIGKANFPNAKRIMITCDCGGSNRAKGQLWKEQLYLFSLVTGLKVYVSHFPTGCSKWNKVEHRLFAYISKNWQGQPLVDIQTCVNLISNTTTTTGLKVVCRVDYSKYKLNNQYFSKRRFSTLPIEPNGDLGKWNYIIDATVQG